MHLDKRATRKEFRKRIEFLEMQIAVDTELVDKLKDELLHAKGRVRDATKDLFRVKKLLAKVPPEQIPTREEDLTAMAIRQSEYDRKAAGIPASDRYATERYADRGNAGRPPLERSHITDALVLRTTTLCDWRTGGIALAGEYSDISADEAELDGPHIADASITGLPDIGSD